MSYLSTNLKFLRVRLKNSQEEMAATLGMTRTKIASYEAGNSKNLPIDDLVSISNSFKISIDTLIKVDLKKVGELKLRELESGNDMYVSGTKLRVLATTVDANNNDNIEVVPIKAKAGYLAGFNDPEFIETLQTFQLPVLSNNRKYRMFQIEGDSMLPIANKSFIVAEYIDDWKQLKDGEACIVLTKNDGIAFKIVYNKLKTENCFLMHSLNPEFDDYKVHASEILEIWNFVSYFSRDLPKQNVNVSRLSELVDELKVEVQRLESN
jgi:transcriptional regulator with XRE-family HTH domain